MQNESRVEDKPETQDEDDVIFLGPLPDSASSVSSGGRNYSVIQFVSGTSGKSALFKYAKIIKSSSTLQLRRFASTIHPLSTTPRQMPTGFELVQLLVVRVKMFNDLYKLEVGA